MASSPSSSGEPPNVPSSSSGTGTNTAMSGLPATHVNGVRATTALSMLNFARTLRGVPRTNLDNTNNGKGLLGISSLSTSINSLFAEHSFPLGKITELCGAPGVGKTQACIQLALCSLFDEMGGSNTGLALYIDTEGSFDATRAIEIANHVRDHVITIRRRTGEGPVSENDVPTAEQLLQRIIYFRVLDHYQLIALMYQLSNYIGSLVSGDSDQGVAKATPVKFVCIDSIAFHFRQSFGYDVATRAKFLHLVAAEIRRATMRYNLCTIVVNQLTAKYGVEFAAKGDPRTSVLVKRRRDDKDGTHDTGFSPTPRLRSDTKATKEPHLEVNEEEVGENEDKATNIPTATVLVPALGDAWSHIITNRVILYWDGDVRNAVLVKSPNSAPKNVKYAVASPGLVEETYNDSHKEWSQAAAAAAASNPAISGLSIHRAKTPPLTRKHHSGGGSSSRGAVAETTGDKSRMNDIAGDGEVNKIIDMSNNEVNHVETKIGRHPTMNLQPLSQIIRESENAATSLSSSSQGKNGGSSSNPDPLLFVDADEDDAGDLDGVDLDVLLRSVSAAEQNATTRINVSNEYQQNDVDNPINTIPKVENVNVGDVPEDGDEFEMFSDIDIENLAGN